MVDELVDQLPEPALVAIDPDDGWAKDVGVLPDGRQHFVTWPFHVLSTEATLDFAALYIFDASGRLIGADIRQILGDDSSKNVEDELFVQMPGRREGRISVKPFSIVKFSLRFGLIAEFIEEFGEWKVRAIPGDYMEFFAPWDSGIHDT